MPINSNPIRAKFELDALRILKAILPPKIMAQ